MCILRLQSCRHLALTIYVIFGTPLNFRNPSEHLESPTKIFHPSQKF